MYEVVYEASVWSVGVTTASRYALDLPVYDTRSTSRNKLERISARGGNVVRLAAFS